MKHLYIAVAALLPALACAQSPFDGTWRPDPQVPGPNAPPDLIVLNGGLYDCPSCTPPYKIQADGTDHAVTGSPYFDTISITIVDAHSVHKVAKKQGQVIADTVDTVAADGASRTAVQTVNGMLPIPVEIATTFSRAAAGPAGSHAVSGKWRELQTDLTHHEEDTTYTVTGNTLSMSDKLGRSFNAPLDGSDAPYKGDVNYTTVSVRQFDPHTIEESDKHNGVLVQVNRWTIDADGKTIHARFDDGHGHVQEQTGHKVP